MASFLQNHGDIILDAVLTDYGRRLLAKGDGSFNIVKFAFGDDEIDYKLFDPTVDSVSQDLEIMRTPILEAFTNNAASMKSQLITLGMTNILFLPILKLNTNLNKPYSEDVFKGYIIPVNTELEKTTNALTGSSTKISGFSVTKSPIVGVLTNKKLIVVDQGLDSNKLDQTQNLKDINPALYENSYNIYIDSRFGYIADNSGNTIQPLSIDDDGVAIYKFTEQSVGPNASQVTQIEYSSENSDNQIILGTQGSRLRFSVIPNNNLTTDTYFDRYGDSGIKLNSEQTSKDFKTLRSTVRVVGVTTGYTLEIPILYAKVQVS